jgi:SnoaL-like domain
MNTSTIEQHWNAYMDAFSATAEDERTRLLEQSVSGDVIFTNPGGKGQGRAALFDHIGQFQKANPGNYFSTEKIYAQPDKLLAVWSMHKPDGTAVVKGYNFVRPDRDFRFEYMAGFF